MYSSIFNNEQDIRKPVCAGRFYPENKNELIELINHIHITEQDDFDSSLLAHAICGAIVPHAGYIYSGYQAVHAFEIIKNYKQQVDTFIVINPNHTGAYEGNFNLCTAKKWATPLGELEVDTELSNLLKIEYFNAAHHNEHAGEVILPFLQYFIPYQFKIVPITMNRQNYTAANELATRLKKAAEALSRKIMIIASSDFSHFETPLKGYEKDQLVVDQIIQLNTKAIEERVNQHNISMCGYGPVMTLIEYAKLCCDRPNMRLLKRGHSGTVSPSETVVDYISFICYH